MLTLILSKADVKSRGPVSAILTLGLAIRIRNMPTANLLPSHDTRCDFEDSNISVPATSAMPMVTHFYP